METIFDQNPDREFNSYEQNLERNYPPSEQAGIRASDQRAAYQAATLKLNAEKEAQNVRDTGIRLGIEQAKEARAVTADTLANAKNSAENAFKEREREFEQKAAEQVAPMLQEIKKRRNPAGYLSFADQTEIDLMFTFASQSKNPNITKMRDQERSLATNIMEREAANSEIRDKEERARNKETEERIRLQGMAKDLPISQVVSDGVTYKKPDLPKPKEEISDTYVKYNADLVAARKSLGIPVAKNPKDQIPLPFDIQKQFEARGTALTKGKPTPALAEQPQFTVGNPSGMPVAPAAPAPAAPVAPAANAAAIEWLKANPNDPRATAIKAKLGLQ